MLIKRKVIIVFFGLIAGLLGMNSANAQCVIIVDTANMTQVTCPGGANGFANLTQVPYINYSWDNITNGLNYGSGPTLTSVGTLEAGLYVVTGTTPFSGSCPQSSSSDTFEILEPILTNALNPPLNCFSNCDVTSIININQQFPGYTYQASVNGGTSGPIPHTTTSLCSGTQTYTVSYDSSGTIINCPSSTFTVNQDSLSAQVVIIDTIKCFGELADIQVYVSGQNSPDSSWYHYEVEYQIFGTWYTLTNQYSYDTATITNLPANTYRITVTDSLNNFTGCQTQIIINIQQPPNIMPTFTITEPSLCFGDSIAELELTVFGGIPPYQIYWGCSGNPPPPLSLCPGVPAIQMTNNVMTFTSLPAGTYPVLISDSNNCLKARTQTIISPPELLVNSIIQSNYNGHDISCFGGSDGAILAQPISGGTPPLEFSINGGTFGPNPYFQNLSSGQHIIAYRDSNGCETSDTLILQDPPDLAGTISVSSAISCNGTCDGQLTFNVDPNLTGTPTYQYSLNGGALQTPATFGGLCGDLNYTITVQDLNGCTFSASLYLTQADSLEIYASVMSNYSGWGVSCYDSTNGIISVDSVNGGTPNYTASIDGGAFLPAMPPTPYTVFPGLDGGLHTIVVQDNSGCLDTVYITITEPPVYSIALTTNVNYNGFDVSCCNSCGPPITGNGSIHVTSTGGVPSYLYSLNGGLSQASANFNSPNYLICATTHTVDATDANGCPASDSILLIEPPCLTLQMDSVMENCGAGDGQAIVIVSGGVTPYFYLWTDGQTTSTATNLSTGWYSVIVTDTNGCTESDSVFVPGTDMTVSTASTDVSCNGVNDGTATVTVIGTYAPPLTYQWTDPNFQITPTATGLAAGTYTVTVTDGNGCFIDTTITVNEPDEVNLELDSVNSLFLVPCYGDSLGVVSVSVTGGTPFYMFYINAATPQFDSTFYGLPAGYSWIFVTDINGCTDSIDVQISEPAIITFTLSSTDVLCNGDSTGTAEIATISGGTPPYFYSWNNGATTDSIGGLSIGQYWVTVTDVSGCTVYPPDTVTINEPTLLTAAVSSTPSNCGGTVQNGTAGVIASGGTTPYSYSWSTGATTANITGLVAGSYPVTITDANGCVVNDIAIVQAGPNPSMAANLAIDVSCFGAGDGYLVPNATGGTPPLAFSINGSLFSYSIGDTIGPSGGASYWITVIDALGCTDQDSVFVTEPALLVVDSFSVNEVSCYGGSDGEITVIPSGGTPGYTYLWSDGQTNATATGLSIDTFGVIVVDTNGCADSASVIMTQPDSLYILSITSTDVLCNGDTNGTATVTAQGGVSPYSYLWSHGAITQTANMFAGNYSVDVTDFNGCMVSASITVNEPPVLATDYFVMDSVSCFGFSDGSATVYALGGVPPYNYFWDNGATIDFADNLAAGYHVVTITDSNNCEHIDSVLVLEPAASVSIDSLIVSQITCNNASNGSIVVLATGGTPSYTYSKDGGINYQTAIGFIGLSPATYNMVVKDNNGCTDSVSVTIIEPAPLLIDSVVYHDVSCNGYDNGYIQTIDVNGGTQPYAYSVHTTSPPTTWGPYSTLASFNGFWPGTYTVEVIDDNNCVVADIITITEPQILATTITTSASLPSHHGYGISCNGGNDGSISVLTSGGVAPYLKTWIDAAGNTIQSSNAPSVNSLIAGLYTLIVTDAQACMHSQFISLTEPTPLQHNIVITHVTCEDSSTGSITDSVFGGVPGYTYLWNTGASTYTITNLPVGTYTDTVTDLNGCKSDITVSINDDDKLEAQVVNIQNVSCYGYCDGFIEVEITGGMPFFNSIGNPIYTNIWDDPLSQITANAIGLCASNDTLSTTYTDTITDAIGCQVVVSGTVTQPEELIVTASVIDEISCYSGNDGEVRAVATGGTPAGSSYTYDWNTTAPSTTGVYSTLSNLGTGSYVVIVTDANGCMDTTEIFLDQPTDLSVTVASTNINCFGDDNGTITATPVGGTPIPPSDIYTYLWSDGQTTQTANLLAPGLYTVTVTDDNGCTVSSSNVLITQPANPLIVTADSVDATICGGPDNGEAIGCAFGGTSPYSFVWSTGIIGISPDCHTIYGLSSGPYTVNVTDANGCPASASTTVNGNESIFLPNFSNYYEETICLGDITTISVVNNTAYTYIWRWFVDGIPYSLYGETITVSPEETTNYWLTVVDPSCNDSIQINAKIIVDFLPVIPYGLANGETYTSSNNELTEVPIKLNDQVVLGSSYWYDTITWSTGEIGQTINVSPDVTTTYYVMVGNIQGCQGYDSIRVVVGIMIYDGISPNRDGYNDFWEIEDIDRYPDAVIEVYNRWGSLLFSAKGDTYNSNKWDGTHEGEPLPIGTYYYIINLNNGSDLQSGPITIIR